VEVSAVTRETVVWRGQGWRCQGEDLRHLRVLHRLSTPTSHFRPWGSAIHKTNKTNESCPCVLLVRELKSLCAVAQVLAYFGAGARAGGRDRRTKRGEERKARGTYVPTKGTKKPMPS
jgi:hypothetical protein